MYTVNAMDQLKKVIIHGTAISYGCAKFGAFVNSVTILTLRDLTIKTFRRKEVYNFAPEISY